ncbi:MAG: type VI secretion IcmF C-terminal domain-containing protein [Polyangia bacterium]
MLLLAAQTTPTSTGAGPRLWVVLLIVLVVVALAVGVVLFLRWRSRRATPSGVRGGMARNRLRLVWQRFLAGLPRAARPIVETYPWVIVVGPQGAGKSEVVNARVDWQGQTSQLFPSYTADEYLKIYLGNRVVVHELAGPILFDRTQPIADALTELWTPLCQRKEPTVVVVLSTLQLARSTPEQVQKLADLLRGKLGILHKLCGKPVRTRFVLTGLDQAEGFDVLAKFLRDHDIPLDLPLDTLDPEAEQLVPLLQKYEEYLPLALTKLPARDFRLVVESLVNAPRTLAETKEFLRKLQERGSLAPLPSLDRLYLATRAKTHHGRNPFFVPQDAPLLRLSSEGGARSLRGFVLGVLGSLPLRHVIACGAVLALVVFLCAAVYRRHHGEVERAEEAVAALQHSVARAQGSLNPPHESAAVRAAEVDASERLAAAEVGQTRWPLLSHAFTDEKEQARRQFLEQLRQTYFVPITKASTGSDPASRERLIYALAALYASRDNSLGELVRTRTAEWSGVLGVPETVLKDYVRHSQTAWPDVLPLAVVQSSEPAGSPLVDIAPWLRYLAQLKAVMQAGFVSRPDLKRLQSGAATLSEALNQLARTQSSARLLRILSEESPLDVARLFGSSTTTPSSALSPSAWLIENGAPLRRLFEVVQGSTAESTSDPAGNMNVAQLISVLTAKPEPGKPADGKAAAGKDEVLHFTIDKQEFLFSVKEWQALLDQSRKKQLLRSILGTPDKDKSDEPRGKRRSKRAHGGRSHRGGKQEGGKGGGASGDEGSDGAGGDSGSGGDSGKGSGSGNSGDSGKGGGGDPDDEGSGGGGGGKRPRSLSMLDGAGLPSVGPAGDGSGKASLAGIYTKAAFEREVKPALLGADKAIAEAPLTAREKAALTKFLAEQARRYARRYREALLAYYNSFSQKADTVPALRSALSSLSQPDAPLLLHMKTVAENADLGDLSSPYLQPLAEQLMLFRPVVKLMAQKDGAYAEFDKYRALLQPLVQQLDGAGPPLGPPVTPALEGALSGTGRAALGIWLELESSVQKQVEAFLDKAGLPLEMRRPWLFLLQRALKLGQGEVEKLVAERWADLMKRTVRPLLGRFPFSRGAPKEVEPEQLAGALHPTSGAVWQFVQQYLSPFYSDGGNGVLSARRLSNGPLKLPEDTSSVLQRLARLRKILFDDKGERQLLTFKVRPLPLPQSTTEKPGDEVTRSYLTVGKSTVAGFNQLPTDRPLQVAWWTIEPATVGVDLGAPNSTTRYHESVDAPAGPWSLFRLLARGQIDDQYAIAWTVRGERLRTPLQVKFQFENNPWSQFQILAWSDEP